MSNTSTPLNPSLAALRQFAQRREAPIELCEMCSLQLPSQHRHLIDPQTRQLVCSCDACALLFPNQPGLKYRSIPRDACALPQFQLSDMQWNNLLIPINMAFFFHSSVAERVVAMYPSPAGATESLLDLDAWNSILTDNPILAKLEPDVEALLVNRLGEMRGQLVEEYYIAPIDQCYELVGLIRTHWRGLSGGNDVWREIRAFFETMKGRARCSS